MLVINWGSFMVISIHVRHQSPDNNKLLKSLKLCIKAPPSLTMTCTECPHLNHAEEDRRVGPCLSDSSGWRTGRGSIRSDKGPKRALSFLSGGLFVLERCASLLLGVGTCSSQSSWLPLAQDQPPAGLCVTHWIFSWRKEAKETENVYKERQNDYKKIGNIF